MSNPEIRLNTESDVDWKQMAEFMRQMLVTLDGLWFMHVHQVHGQEQTLKMDISVMKAQFKMATRLWRAMNKLDGQSIDDKSQVFAAMAHLYGHDFDIVVDEEESTVTFRLKTCTFYENLKRVGRDKEHDCRILCSEMAPTWFKEIEPRTGGEGTVDLQLPTGGPHCDWCIKHPRDEA